MLNVNILKNGIILNMYFLKLIDGFTRSDKDMSLVDFTVCF